MFYVCHCRHNFCQNIARRQKNENSRYPEPLVFCVVNSIFCMIIEILLYTAGALTWDYSWWNASFPVLIVNFGYLTFFVVSYWAFNMEKVKKKIYTPTDISGVGLAPLLVFGVRLGWI